MTETSAGEDRNLRRWRISLTVAAWVLVVQSAVAVVLGLVGMALAPLADRGVMTGQFGTMLDRASLAMLDDLMRRTAQLNQIQTIGSLVLLVGSIGLLRRKKWGWYTVVAVHVSAAVAVFIWVMPMFETLYRALDPRSAGTMALVMAILGALGPAVVVAFLLLRPVVSQFQQQGSRIPGV
jgi:hypothetical protein